MSAKEKPAGAEILLDRKVAAVLPFASKDQTRPVLTGVHITPTYAEATDPYRLIRVDIDRNLRPDDFPKLNGEPATGEVPATGVVVAASALKSAFRSLEGRRGPSGVLPILSCVALKPAGSSVRLTTTDLDHTVIDETRAIEGTFPSLDGLLSPESEPEAVVYLDARFLRDMANAVVAFHGRGARSRRTRHTPFGSEVIKLELYGKTKPVRFSASCDGRTLEGVQMPVRPGEGW